MMTNSIYILYYFSINKRKMKIVCKTSDLLQTLQFVSRAVSSQQALPILQNILLQTESGTCRVSATDLELSITSILPVTVEKEGSITVPVKALLNFVQYNSQEETTLEVIAEGKLRCASVQTKTILCSEPTEHYPKIEMLKEKDQVFFEPLSLLEGLHLTTFAAARSSLRPVLSGVYVKVQEEGMIVVATDSYRLSEYVLPVSTEGKEVECIVPVKVLEELKGVIGGSQKTKKPSKEEVPLTVAVALSTQQVQFTIGSTRVLSRLIDGRFPNYKQIIPTETKTVATFSVSELTTTVKRMHYFAKEMNNTLTFTFSKGSVHISTPQTQLGSEESTLSVATSGQENKIALSSSYCLDFLSHIEDGEVEMCVQDSMHPAVFRVPGKEYVLHLIMPLRIQEDV